MSSLPEMQFMFGRALRNNSSSGIAPALWAMFSEPEAVAERRLAAYRRNVVGNWRSALASTYPVLAQLLGPQRFGELADQYIVVCPSKCGDLNAYGEGLAAQLEASSLSKALPYLPDMARLEWALLVAYGAEDAAVPDLAALSAVPACAQANLRFQVWSGAALIESPWPLVEIWRAHQWDPEQRDIALAGIDPDRSSTLCRGLVIRSEGSVSVQELSVGEAVFLRELRSGQSLGEAIRAALMDEEEFNPGATLKDFISSRTLSGFFLPESTQDIPQEKAEQQHDVRRTR